MPTISIQQLTTNLTGTRIFLLPAKYAGNSLQADKPFFPTL
jgi:hypothetical protein